MPLSTTLQKFEAPMLASDVKQLLGCTHDDSPIMIKLGDKFVHVREFRQVSFGPGEPVCRVLVPVDFSVETK